MKLTREQEARQLYAVSHQAGYLQAAADANVETKPETLEQYFSRRNTPSRYSPTGNTMVRILGKYPEMSFEDARTKANELLNIAAKARIYRRPIVRSAAELARSKERLGRVFGRSKQSERLATTPIPGDPSYTVQKNPGSHVVSPIPAAQVLETVPTASGSPNLGGQTQ